MTEIYTTASNALQLTIDTRQQGWFVEVSMWNPSEDCFDILYSAYVIAESLYEAAFDALIESNLAYEVAESLLDTWGFVEPTEDN